MAQTNNQQKDRDIICYSHGGIDLQINGALGIAFNQLTADTAHRIPEICRFLWQQGVDGFLPTLVTTSVESITTALEILQTAMRQPQLQDRAQILGVHLEGPFLNPDKRGAHPQQYLLPLAIAEVKRVLGEFAPIVKLITLAPELDPTNTVIPFLVEQGITVSLGHSTATAAQAKQAFAQGATMITHAFNAMPSLHHREPGLLGEALTQEKVWCGLIADGVHVHPQMVDLIFRLKGASNTPHIPHPKLILVSDALAPLGLPDGLYPWDDRAITVKSGTARLENGTLSGTTLPLLDCVKNLVRWGLCEPEQAIALATITPRQALNLPITSSRSLGWYWHSEGELAWQEVES